MISILNPSPWDLSARDCSSTRSEVSLHCLSVWQVDSVHAPPRSSELTRSISDSSNFALARSLSANQGREI